MVSYDIFYGSQYPSLIDDYLPPSTLNHSPDLKEATNHFLRRYLIFMGGLNADVGRMQNPRNHKVADFLSSLGMVDLLGHFRKLLQFQHK